MKAIIIYLTETASQHVLQHITRKTPFQATFNAFSVPHLVGSAMILLLALAVTRTLLFLIFKTELVNRVAPKDITQQECFSVYLAAGDALFVIARLNASPA